MTFLALAAVIAVGSAAAAWVHGYWRGQRGPDPVDLDEPGFTDVQPAIRIHVGGWVPRRWHRDYSLDRGPAPTPKPKRRAPRNRAQKARAA